MRKMSKRIKVNEWLTDINNGLFNTITFDYLPFESTHLNVLYLAHSGNKPVSVLVERMENDTQEIAKVVEHFFKGKWKKAFDMLVADLPLTDSSRTEVETISGTANSNVTSNSSGTAESLGDVSADNASYINAEKNTSSSTSASENQGTETKAQERTLTVNGTNNHLSDIINKNLDVLEVNFLYDIVFRDIDSLLTLKIYQED